MPVVGSESGVTGSFGEIPNVPEKYQAAVRRGIHFFELKFPKPTDSDQMVYGPYDVLAKETWNTMQNKTEFHIKWLRENEAHIRFTPNNKGVAVAWMPDDKFWRNRIYLMDTPLLNQSLFAYHTNGGQYPGSVIRQEIVCLREVLKTEKTIYKVLRNKREIVFYYDKREAEEFVNDQVEVKHKLDKVTGEMKAITNKHKFEIVPGKKLEYRDEILELIKRENGKHDFGWTESEMFQKEIKPKVVALIKERIQKDKTPADEKQNILNILRSLSDEEKKELLSQSKPTIPESTHEKDDDKGDLDSEINPWEKRKIGDYRKMRKELLLKIYRGRGNVVEEDEITHVKLCDELSGQDKDLEEGSPNLTKPEEIIT